jgi:hypothetical protein
MRAELIPGITFRPDGIRNDSHPGMHISIGVTASSGDIRLKSPRSNSRGRP